MHAHQVEAVNHMTEAVNNPGYEEKAKESIAEARKLYEAVKIIIAIRDQKEHKIFSTTPTKITEPPPKG